MRDTRLSSRRGVDAYLAEVLSEAVARNSRRPSVFVITAEAGAGKSRVLREALERTSTPFRRTAVSETGGHEPYALAADLLGTRLERPVPADAPEQLMARLDDLCASGPLLLAVDDAHAADAASLLSLRHMASATRDLPLALLMTRRPTPQREHLARLLRLPGVVEIELPPMDGMDLDALVHEHTGQWPSHRLRTLLGSHRSNALRVLTLLDDLSRVGALATTGDTLDLLPGQRAEEAARGGLDEAVTASLVTLEGPAREVARILAVLGRPASVEEIAEVAGMRPVAVTEPVQVLLDREIGQFDQHGRLAFTHETYREAIEHGTPPPLRRVLHAAAAELHDEPTRRVRHVIAAAGSAAEVLSAVQDAAEDLAHVPAVEADLLADEAVTSDLSTASVSLAVRRARALARSGQTTRAETVARGALSHAKDPALITELRRVLIFALTLKGDARAALDLVDEALATPGSEHVRDILDQHRLQLTQLAGLDPLSLRPPVPDPLNLTLTGLNTEAVRLSLIGYPQLALELSWEASRRHMSEGVDPYEGASSDVWPPFIELLASGPRAADDAMRQVVRLSDERVARWQSAPHQFLRAWVDLSAGRLSDAAAAYDVGLELAEAAEFGWTSTAVAGRALLDVLFGQPDAAEARLRAWKSEPRPLQFGIPGPDRVEVLLLEARRRYREGAQLARSVWRSASAGHLYTWLALAAPDLSRVALRGGDEGLRATIARDLARLPHPLSPALAPSVHLAQALTDAGTAAVDTSARCHAAAKEAHRTGEALVELAAWEEAAVADASAGSKDSAREYARRAVRRAEEIGAIGASQRVVQRMRAAGVRMRSAQAGRRPLSGWAALTPTESQVAGMVASGLSGPDIARTLNISTRTVQSHVSHTLSKLDLATRIELAAAVRERQRS